MTIDGWVQFGREVGVEDRHRPRRTLQRDLEELRDPWVYTWVPEYLREEVRDGILRGYVEGRRVQ